MDYVTLNNGIEMPILGFGVYQIDDLAQCERCVEEALEVGYRSIDTAAAYFNEEAVGKAIKRSAISRSELFITTKLWLQDAGYDKAMRAFELSLKKLQLDYLDLYLIHQPFNDVYGSWRAMQELYRQGRIKAIGVSNFLPDRIMDFILHNEIVPSVNQIETHPYYQQTEAAKFLSNNNIQTESWGPFAEGKDGLFQNTTLVSVAQKHNRSVAQVVLRWLIQRGIVVIPKSVRKDRMAENFNIFDFKLDEADMASIATLDRGKSCFFDHRDPETVKYVSGVKIY